MGDKNPKKRPKTKKVVEKVNANLHSEATKTPEFASKAKRK